MKYFAVLDKANGHKLNEVTASRIGIPNGSDVVKLTTMEFWLAWACGGDLIKAIKVLQALDARIQRMMNS
jgi:hypothetical protein